MESSAACCREQLPRFREQLVVGQMVFINGDRADDALRHVMVMLLEIQKQMFHRATGSGSRSKDQDLLGSTKGLGDGFVEALSLRPKLPVATSVREVQVAAKSVRVIWPNVLGRRAMQLRTEDPSLLMIDDHKQVRARRERRCLRTAGSLDEMADANDFVRIGDVFAMRSMKHQHMVISSDLEVSVVLLHYRGIGHAAKHR